ncbi:hypothetical protein EsHS_00000469 [Epichloe bromicola]
MMAGSRPFAPPQMYPGLNPATQVQQPVFNQAQTDSGSFASHYSGSTVFPQQTLLNYGNDMGADLSGDYNYLSDPTMSLQSTEISDLRVPDSFEALSGQAGGGAPYAFTTGINSDDARAMSTNLGIGMSSLPTSSLSQTTDSQIYNHPETSQGSFPSPMTSLLSSYDQYGQMSSHNYRHPVGQPMIYNPKSHAPQQPVQLDQPGRASGHGKQVSGDATMRNNPGYQRQPTPAGPRLGNNPKATRDMSQSQTQAPKRTFSNEEWQGGGRAAQPRSREIPGPLQKLSPEQAALISEVIERGLRNAFAAGCRKAHAKINTFLQQELHENKTVAGIDVILQNDCITTGMSKSIEKRMTQCYKRVNENMLEDEKLDEIRKEIRDNMRKNHETGATSEVVLPEVQAAAAKRRGKPRPRGGNVARGVAYNNDNDTANGIRSRTRTYSHGGIEFTSQLCDDGVWRIEKVRKESETTRGPATKTEAAGSNSNDDLSDTVAGAPGTPSSIRKRKASRAPLHGSMPKKAKDRRTSRAHSTETAGMMMGEEEVEEVEAFGAPVGSMTSQIGEEIERSTSSTHYVPDVDRHDGTFNGAASQVDHDTGEYNKHDEISSTLGRVPSTGLPAEPAGKEPRMTNSTGGSLHAAPSQDGVETDPERAGGAAVEEEGEETGHVEQIPADGGAAGESEQPDDASRRRVKELIRLDNGMPHSLIRDFMKPRAESIYSAVREAADRMDLADQSHLLFDRDCRRVAMKEYDCHSRQQFQITPEDHPEWNPVVRNAEKRARKKLKRLAERKADEERLQVRGQTGAALRGETGTTAFGEATDGRATETTTSKSGGRWASLEADMSVGGDEHVGRQDGRIGTLPGSDGIDVVDIDDCDRQTREDEFFHSLQRGWDGGNRPL